MIKDLIDELLSTGLTVFWVYLQDKWGKKQIFFVISTRAKTIP